jgi:hypothetical protein
MRVQIPAYTDRWMMGDRYGEVVDKLTSRIRGMNGRASVEIVKVRLDKSGKTVRVRLDDCTVVEVG